MLFLLGSACLWASNTSWTFSSSSPCWLFCGTHALREGVCHEFYFLAISVLPCAFVFMCVLSPPRLITGYSPYCVAIVYIYFVWVLDLNPPVSLSTLVIVLCTSKLCSFLFIKSIFMSRLHSFDLCLCYCLRLWIILVYFCLSVSPPLLRTENLILGFAQINSNVKQQCWSYTLASCFSSPLTHSNTL